MSFDIPIADQMRIALSYVKFKTRQKNLRTTDKVIADTVYGKVKGVKWHNIYGGTPYFSFEGIPFAKPPLGELRFKAPVEPEPWSEVKRCTRTRSKPTQMNIILKQVQGKEDCLYLNVYTRQVHPRKPLPVLVWIYGGGFQMGEASRDLYSPDYFMMEHVVLVTISYRLGPLGFLSLDDEELDIPGNAGLKDQVMALKWVSKNIQFFGGDPDNVTVFGESAGGASTHYMMLTDQTKDIFHKGVVMSGSAIACWANIPRNNWAYRLAKATGYQGLKNDKDVLKHLKQCKPSSMFKVSEEIVSLEERHARIMFSFGPTIEPYITNSCVISKSPLEMMRDCWGNSIPLLIGGNTHEGLLMFTEVRKYPQLLHNLVDFENLTPADAHLTKQKRIEFGLQLKEMYFGDKKPTWESIINYTDLCSYKYFWHGIHRTLYSRLHYGDAPTYLYRFAFDSKHFNFMRIITCGRKVRGTCHADDLSYMFYNAGAKKLKHRSAEFKTIRRLVTMLVKFAECGNPNIPMTTSLDEIHTKNIIQNGHDESRIEFKANNKIGEQPQENRKEDKKQLIGNGYGDDFNSKDKQQLVGHHHGQQSNSHQEHLPGEVISHLPIEKENVPNMLKQNENENENEIENENPALKSPPIQRILNETKNGSDIAEWPPVNLEQKVFKCLNISDELKVIDLPEAEKLKLWDSMYEDKNLLY